MNKKILLMFIVLLVFILAVGCKKETKKASSEETLNSGVIKVDVTDDQSENNNSSEENQSDKTDSDATSSEDNSSDSSDNETNSENNSSSDSSDNESSSVNNSNQSDSSDKNNSFNNSSKPNTTNKPSNSNDKNNNQNKPNNTNDNNVDSNKNDESDKTNQPDNNDSDSDNNLKPDKPSNNNSNKPSDKNDNNSTSKPNDKTKEYESINCRPSAEISWKKVELVVNNIKFNLRLSLPDDWSISSDGSILRDGNVIGNVVTKSPSSIIETYEESNRTQIDNNSIIVKKSIYKNTKNEFKRLFSLSRLGNIGVMKTVYIDVNYSELNSESASKLYDQFKFTETKTTIPVVEANKSVNILILGSKSISEDYAKISSFFKTMCDTAGITNLNVEIITKTKSTALSNFASEDQLSKIKNGGYNYVFLSGFDSGSGSFGNMDDNGYFSKIYNTCQDINAKLIVLPSFDDDMNIVHTILEKYEKTLILNLKGELNNLIDFSVGTDKILSNSDIVDSDNHLTKYGGFIASHLIFRNIFGKVPPVINSTELAYTDIESKFNINYLTTGVLSGNEEIVSYILN